MPIMRPVANKTPKIRLRSWFTVFQVPFLFRFSGSFSFASITPVVSGVLFELFFTKSTFTFIFVQIRPHSISNILSYAILYDKKIL